MSPFNQIEVKTHSSENVKEYCDDLQNQFQEILDNEVESQMMIKIKDLVVGHRHAMLEILVANQYLSILKYLAEEHQPPLITSGDVVTCDLFSFFIDGRHLYHHDFSKVHDPQIFRLLLDVMNPLDIGLTFGVDGYLPIQIFTKFVANNIEGDNEFFADLKRLLALGFENCLGDTDGVCGYGGLFIRRQNSKTLEAPISLLFHHFKYGYRESGPIHILDSPRFISSIQSLGAKNCLLESAVMNEVGLCFVEDILDRESNRGSTRNFDGRLPLHYSICSKQLEWFALKKVIEVNVSALGEPDPVTGLLPFMLAASVEYDFNTLKCGLEIIYTILRMRPIIPFTNECAREQKLPIRGERKRKAMA